MGNSYRRGYIAISRAIFEHPLLKSKKPFSRLEAWQWLINAAGWIERGNRNKFGTIHTERGQLCITRRQLGDSWNWPKSNVDRFLRKLAQEGMILLGKALNGPKNNPKEGPTIGYPMTMVTICNYDKFQHIGRGRKGQSESQKAGQNQPLLPIIVGEDRPQPTNNPSIESRGGLRETRNRNKPPHGARGRGMIWFDHNTTEWQAYALNFREAHGVDKLPENRIGGRGNWFRWLGERAQTA
jgi:hypothetical protein